MELWDFFNQQGVAQLCLVTAGAAVLLVIMIWWMWYRRATRAKKLRAELAPQPPPEPQPQTPARFRAGVWGAVVNFFMEPPKEAEKPGAARTTAPDDADAPGLEPAARDTAPVMQAAAVEVREMEQNIPPPVPSAASEPETAPVPTAAPPHAEEPAPASPESALGPIVSFGAGGRTSPAESPRAEGSAPLPAQPPAGARGPSGTPRDAVEVMRVWRDLADGSLIVDFGGQRYRNLVEVQDPDLRRRFLALLRSLSQMAGLEAANADKPAAVPPPTGAVGLHDAINRIKTDEGGQEQPHMLRQLGRVLSGQTTNPAATAASSMGIVGQIEDFLQYKLQHTAGFTDRSIHIRQSVSGVGVSIEVDGHFYEGVGDVADADVREFLQETIQEWQNRQ